MISKKDLFLSYVAQTSPLSMALEIDHAKGIHIYDTSGKRYYDMNSGISVSSLGHCHPKVTQAIKDQVDRYMHTMVYGEHNQSPQTAYAQLLIEQLDDHFESLYYLMSGTEATELAMKIGKRYTGRSEIICARNAYHGSTQGAESLRSDEDYKEPFLPLLPGIRHIDFNCIRDVQLITERTSCVIIEAVQGEAGVIPPTPGYLHMIRQHCTEVGALFIIDEIQSGFGRTGHLFAHQKYGVIPDIMLIGKAMGGGMPIAGVVSSKEIMNCLIKKPVLGHITTFGGHPVSCAASLAALEVLLEDNLIASVQEKEQFIRQKLSHNLVKEIRSSGLMMAVEITKLKYLKHIVAYAVDHGVLVDWFLFNNRSFRLSPPLIATIEDLDKASDILLAAMDYAEKKYKK
jgi:acetylornithine/succinyldiaminopimelate/putrescine aminotransferase